MVLPAGPPPKMRTSVSLGIVIGSFSPRAAVAFSLPADDGDPSCPLDRALECRTHDRADPHSPSRPEVGWARQLLGDYHVTGLFWYRFHKWAVSTLPAWTLWPITITFTTFFFCTIFKIRRAIASNLETALGPCGFLERQRRIYATMWTFGWCLSERYERLTTDRHFDLTIEALEHWNAVASSDRGFVMVTAHLGMYEVSSMLPTPNGPRHVHLVREPEVDPRAQEFIRQSVRARRGSHYTMHFQSDDPLQGMIFLDALRRGEIVAMQGDRPRTGSRTVDASLFGRPIALPSGPAALARTAEVPMLPCSRFAKGAAAAASSSARPSSCLAPTTAGPTSRSAMERVAAEVERAVRRAPHQWFVWRELWPNELRSAAEIGPDRPSERELALDGRRSTAYVVKRRGFRHEPDRSDRGRSSAGNDPRDGERRPRARRDSPDAPRRGRMRCDRRSASQTAAVCAAASSATNAGDRPARDEGAVARDAAEAGRAVVRHAEDPLHEEHRRPVRDQIAKRRRAARGARRHRRSLARRRRVGRRASSRRWRRARRRAAPRSGHLPRRAGSTEIWSTSEGTTSPRNRANGIAGDFRRRRHAVRQRAPDEHELGDSGEDRAAREVSLEQRVARGKLDP